MKNLFRFIFFLLVLCITLNAQWTTFHNMPNASWAGRAEFVDENVFWGVMGFSSGAEGFFRTSDGGVNWYYDSLSTLIYSICPLSSNTAFIGTHDASESSRLIKTTDGGMNWVAQDSVFGNTYQWIDYIYFFDNVNGFALGDPIGGYFEIYTTTNGGGKWNRVSNSNIPVCLNNETPNNTAYAINGNTIWIPTFINGGTSIRIFKSTDMGHTWSVTNPFSSASIELFPTAIAFSNQLEGLLLVSSFWSSGFTTSNYQIFKTSDGGNTWVEINFFIPINPVFMCTIKGTNAGYMVSAPIINAGTAYTIDGGNTWLHADNTAIWDIDFLSPSIGWAFSPFTSGQAIVYKWSGAALPVELLSFTAVADGKNTVLKWSTATELNNNGFEIQRKVAESDFATVGFVKGEGTTTNQKEYSFTDKDLINGKYYYRLKQVDYNGSYEFSDVIEVEVLSIEEYALGQNFPNPFNPTTTIGYVLKEKTNAKLILLNTIGEEVAVLVNESQDKGFHKIDFNANSLSSGVYFYRLQAGEFVQTRKMILLK